MKGDVLAIVDTGDPKEEFGSETVARPVPGDLHGRGPEACEQQVEKAGKRRRPPENLDIILAQFEVMCRGVKEPRRHGTGR